MTARNAARTGALWMAIAALLTARALLAASHSMWFWGLGTQRFLDAFAAWGPWLLAGLLLIPACGRRVARPLERAGQWLKAGRAGTWLAALGGGWLVFGLPDRTWLTGDFLLREGLAESGAFHANLAQALPLEVLVNYALPRLWPWGSSVDPDLPNVVNRLVGAACGAALAATAVRIARAWDLRPIATVLAAATIFWGGYLATFTGLGKPSALLCVLVALLVLAIARLVRGQGGGWLLGTTMAVAFSLHRSALVLVPVWALALVVMARGRAPRRHLLPAAVLPLFALLLSVPRAWQILQEFDLPRHLMPPAARAGGLLATVLAPLRLLDLLNLLVLYSPALVLALVVPFPRAPGGGGRRAEFLLLSALAVSGLPLLLFIEPIQGIFRDLEVFAICGLALTVLAAYVLAWSLSEERVRDWLAAPVIGLVVLCAFQLLVHFHDPGQGLRRARAFAVEPPARPTEEVAQLWDLIAYRAFRLRDWPMAVEAARSSATFAPHERTLTMLAIAQTYAGDFGGAEQTYLDLTRRSPSSPTVWLGLYGAALRTADSANVARAVARLDTLAIDPRNRRLMVQHLRIFPFVVPPEAPIPGSR